MQYQMHRFETEFHRASVRGRRSRLLALRQRRPDLEFEAAVIASGDLKDLRRLSAPYRQISLMAL
jgi:hypothetical protein